MTHAPNARLTPEQVVSTRLEFDEWCRLGGRKSTFVYRKADQYRVGVETIRKLLRGETFRHLAATPEPPASGGADDALAEASLRRLLSEVKDTRSLTADGMLEELLGAGSPPAASAEPRPPSDDPFGP